MKNCPIIEDHARENKDDQADDDECSKNADLQSNGAMADLYAYLKNHNFTIDIQTLNCTIVVENLKTKKWIFKKLLAIGPSPPLEFYMKR